MELEFLASLFDDFTHGQRWELETITSACISNDGDFLAVGDESGRISLIPMQIDGVFPGTGRLKIVTSFTENQYAFDSGKGEFIDKTITGLDFTKETRLNPIMISSNTHECTIHQIIRDEESVYQHVGTKSPDQFIPPSITRKAVTTSISTLTKFRDTTLDTIIGLRSHETSVLLAATNGLVIFDMERSMRKVRLVNAQSDIICFDMNSRHEELIGTGNSHNEFLCYDMRQQPMNLSPSFLLNLGDGPISSCRFSENGTDLAIRTFSNLFLYDIRNTETPFYKFQVQNFPEKQEFLVESGMINDKFGLAFIDDTRIVTGMYSSQMVVIDIEDGLHSRHDVQGPVKRKEFDNPVRNIEIHGNHDVIVTTCGERVFIHEMCDGHVSE